MPPLPGETASMVGLGPQLQVLTGKHYTNRDILLTAQFWSSVLSLFFDSFILVLFYPSPLSLFFCFVLVMDVPVPVGLSKTGIVRVLQSICSGSAAVNMFSLSSGEMSKSFLAFTTYTRCLFSSRSVPVFFLDSTFNLLLP